MGLIGRNGAGKSTLLKVLSGDLKPDQGEIALTGDALVGYLPQDLPLPEGKSVMEETESAFEEIKTLEARIEKINQEIVERTDYESDGYMDLLNELHDANTRFDMIGGHSFHARIEQVLKGLGFRDEDMDKPTETFSGGWRMRIELAKLLLQSPDVLLLDEPTNHLDIESIIWLETFLIQYPGAVILVSHDKTFLNKVTNRTIEVVLGRIYDQKLPYSKFLIWRADVQEKQMAAAKNQEKEIKQTEELIEKFRAKASKAAFAQSLIKKLEKTERIEVDVQDNRAMNFRFAESDPSGKVPVIFNSVGKSFGDKKVFSGVDFEIERGQKVAFVGQNGQGKTTLARMLVGEIQGEGGIEIGYNVKMSYYAQEQHKELDPEQTVLETIESIAPDALRPKVRDLLGAFLFSGDTVFKKVKVLSGGERGRLALCKLLMKPSNFLVMDEPTNHLDINSKEVLKQALAKFSGTLVVVSHDRDFLQGLTEKVFEFRGGKVNQHLGDIDEFLRKRKAEDFRSFELSGQNKKESKNSAKAKNNGKSDQEKRTQEKEVKRLTKKVERLESKIAELEGELAALDAKLQDPNQFKELSENPDFYTKYEELKSEKEKAEADWGNLIEELETKG